MDLSILEKWRDEIVGPAFEVAPHDRSHDRWRQPTLQGMRPKELVPAPLQRLLVQSLVDAVVLMRRLRDRELADSRLAVFVSLPDMWENQVCAFHSELYFETFAQRPDWTPLEGESLIGSLGLELPAGFLERGYKTIQVTNWEPPTEDGELWILYEA